MQQRVSQRLKRRNILSPSSPLSPQLKPFVQGDLDGLCGLYALINALRKITPPSSSITDDDWRDFFAKLICAYPPIAHGAHSRDMAKLARIAQFELTRWRNFRIELRWPLLDRRIVTLSAAIEKLSDVADRRATAIILGFGGKLEHWSVLERVSSSHFILFDSGLYHRVRVDRCRLSRELSANIYEHVIDPAAAIVVSAV